MSLSSLFATIITLPVIKEWDEENAVTISHPCHCDFARSRLKYKQHSMSTVEIISHCCCIHSLMLSRIDDSIYRKVMVTILIIASHDGRATYFCQYQNLPEM